MVNINDLASHSRVAIIIAIIYIFINIYYKSASIIAIFLISLVCVTLFYGLKNITKKTAEIISFALLISIIFSVLLNKNYSEGFKSGKTNKKKVKAEEEEKEEEEEEIKPKKKKKTKKKVSFTEDDDDNDDDTDGFVGDNRLDLGTSFLEAYKNLDKNQIETMANDTKDLIETQKTLMSTLETLAPVVKEGKSIIDTFKGYFDPTEKK